MLSVILLFGRRAIAPIIYSSALISAWANCNQAKTKTLSVVAEYVETQEQRQMLLAFEVDYLQGYLIGKLHPIEELQA